MNRAPQLLGPWLVLSLGAAYFLLGGVGAEARAIVHGFVALACFLAAAYPSVQLRTSGVALRWLRACVPLLAVLALGFLPLPAGLAALVAPGRVAARPGDAWVTLAFDREALLVEVAGFVGLMGFGAAVATWGSARYRRGTTELAITLLTGLLAISAILHAASGARAVGGVLTPDFVPEPFFGPLVNGSHLAAAMLLGAPIAGSLVAEERAEWWERALGLTVSLAGLVLLGWVGSLGAMLVAGGLVGWAALRARKHTPWFVALLAVALAGCSFVAWLAWAGGSVGVRAGLWADTLRLFGAHWLAGSGGGSFERAIQAYRSDNTYIAFAHAHNEPLEWLAETGLLGLAAALAAGAQLRARLTRPSRNGRGLLLGAAAFAVYCLVDFPLQIPAIAMSAVALWVCVLAVFGEQETTRPSLSRVVLAGMGVLQLLGVGVLLREAAVEGAVARIQESRSTPAAALDDIRLLETLHAGAAVRAVHAAWRAEAAGESAEAIALAGQVSVDYPDDVDALRKAAAILARGDARDDAERILTRIMERDPSDNRAWVARARLSERGADEDLRGVGDRWVEAFHHGAPEGNVDEAYAALPVGLFWLQAFEDVDARYSAALAMVLDRAGDLETALLAADQAARLDPAYARTSQRPELLVRLGRGDEARNFMETEILPTAAGDPLVLARYARILSAIGRHGEATEAYLRAARTRPPLRADALRSAEADGGAAKALALARRIALDGAADPETSLEIARILYISGDAQGCANHIERQGLLGTTLGVRASQLQEQCELALEKAPAASAGPSYAP